ncbi:MAG: hypothetical protein QOC66_3711 [Pseudonocardiales bacterium]|jgi:hypothetical protein|nr:hypothetical protein [Pseudonocardiales bacterium]
MESTTYRELPQGDVRLIGDPIARRLLGSDALARLAYLGKDGTPRVIPMGFVWNGSEIVMATFARSAKLAALRARPDVAITIDHAGPPPDVLLVRGRAVLDPVAGVAPEYEQVQRKYYGDEQAEQVLAMIREQGVSMVRIVVAPSWVSTLDFQTRNPGALVAAGLAS